MKSIPFRLQLIMYGVALAILTILLKMMEYRFRIISNATEIYIGLIALLFTAVGIWAGWKLTNKKPVKEIVIVEKEVPAKENFEADLKKIEALGLSERELEVLQLIGAGLSNQEIADKLFLSLNTVKTHTSNLFLKLDVSRRTMAVQKAKELRIIK